LVRENRIKTKDFVVTFTSGTDHEQSGSWLQPDTINGVIQHIELQPYSGVGTALAAGGSTYLSVSTSGQSFSTRKILELVETAIAVGGAVYSPQDSVDNLAGDSMATSGIYAPFAVQDHILVQGYSGLSEQAVSGIVFYI